MMPSLPFQKHPMRERDTGPLEAAEQQGTDQTHSAFDIGCYDEEAESSGRTPASTMSYITITSITGKRVRLSRIQYKYELKPVWLPINLVENA